MCVAAAGTSWFRPFRVTLQHDQMDCGPSCIAMVARHHGRHVPLIELRQRCHISRQGVSLLAMSDAAESIGFRTRLVRVGTRDLGRLPLPCIAHVRQSHFVVIHQVSRSRIFVADPAHGLLRYTFDEFARNFVPSGERDARGAVLLLSPTPAFYQQDEPAVRTGHLSFLLDYLKPHWGLLVQVCLGLGATLALALVAPLLAQSVLDVGVLRQDVRFLYLVLAGQLMVLVGRVSLELIRGWLLLHIGARLNLALVSDFLAKLMRLPLAFFDTRRTGDILQRITDHTRVEAFVTAGTLGTLFSLFLLFAYLAVFTIYSARLAVVFVAGAALAIGWMLLFMRVRRVLDFKRFNESAESSSTILQFIAGMPEIKLSGADRQMRWAWERIQARLFNLQVRGLALGQYQESGATLVLEVNAVILSFLAALETVTGRMTVGMMLAIQYMLGQTTAPLKQLLGVLRSGQDAQLGLERLAEVHEAKDEEEDPGASALRYDVPRAAGITLDRVSFRYGGPRSPLVLDDVSLHIPHGKVTAIVGASGSGKTTLLKLLLRFYAPTSGDIRVGDVNLQQLDVRAWRSVCGAVMQDGYLFSDTIARNIALGFEDLNLTQLVSACRIANVEELIDALPLGYGTKVGADGITLSKGQEQRLLIARAVYKAPSFLFLDEATSALDARNERVIHERLREFVVGRTVVVIAHRLSTVRHADQIVVLDGARVVEVGTHEELVAHRGVYLQLVKNQLELGT